MCKSYINSVPSCMLISFPYNILLKGGDRNSILSFVKLLLSPERHIIIIIIIILYKRLIFGSGDSGWCYTNAKTSTMMCVYIYIYNFFFIHTKHQTIIYLHSQTMKNNVYSRKTSIMQNILKKQVFFTRNGALEFQQHDIFHIVQLGSGPSLFSKKKTNKQKYVF